jgi:hypothetical protein
LVLAYIRFPGAINPLFLGGWGRTRMPSNPFQAKFGSNSQKPMFVCPASLFSMSIIKYE